MKQTIKLLAFCLLTVFGFNTAHSATQAEMEKARAIAAKFYLRFANNGSDYLDNINPSSLSDLESQLKDTEKENLKWFKAAAMPTDYTSWDKARLAEYWSSTFFNNNASSISDEKNREAANNGLAHKSIANAINKMEVTATSQETPETEPAETSIPAQPASQIQAIAEDTGDIESQIAALEEELQNTPEEPIKKEGSSGLWVYIAVLCILVAIVLALVVYAARTMKAQKERQEVLESERQESDRAYEPVAASNTQEERRLREKFAEKLAEKTTEIQALRRTIAQLENQNSELKAEIERLAKTSQPRQSDEPHDSRKVFLGRVNERGVFVRADRNFLAGNSIYCLHTTNGLTGTYRLVNDYQTIAMALENPIKWLEGGCTAKNITATDGKNNIETETSGTAIFEDGAWRVLRKAKVRYE